MDPLLQYFPLPRTFTNKMKNVLVVQPHRREARPRMHSKLAQQPAQAMRAHVINKARPGASCKKITSPQFFNNIISPDTSASEDLTHDRHRCTAVRQLHVFSPYSSASTALTSDRRTSSLSVSCLHARQARPHVFTPDTSASAAIKHDRPSPPHVFSPDTSASAAVTHNRHRCTAVRDLSTSYL